MLEILALSGELSWMRLAVFLNGMGLGGTEKAAGIWALRLAQDPAFQQVRILSLSDGPRRKEWEKAGLEVQVVDAGKIPQALGGTDVIHAHAPGFPHAGDVLGEALARVGKKIPVVQTNIFGKLENPKEEAWTDFRLFISWTSCVQAARRSRRKLDEDFFRHQSVASYSVEPWTEAQIVRLKTQAQMARKSWGLESHHVLFGRFSRPEPNKWTPMVLEAFFQAHRKNPSIRLLLREPPPQVASSLNYKQLATWVETPNPNRPVLLMPATPDGWDLAVSQAACDAILHTSSIGESFGYGIAEAMAVAKPIITHSVPWYDQAQLELVRQGQTGLVASVRGTMLKAILQIASNPEYRQTLGEAAQSHIEKLADSTISTQRLAQAISWAVHGLENSHASADLQRAQLTAANLDSCQWGSSLAEQIYLRGRTCQIGLWRLQRALRSRLASPP